MPVEAGRHLTLQSGVFPQHASIKIHEAVGFKNDRCRERVGNLNGLWEWISSFERRSRLEVVELKLLLLRPLSF